MELFQATDPTAEKTKHPLICPICTFLDSPSSLQFPESCMVVKGVWEEGIVRGGKAVFGKGEGIKRGGQEAKGEGR